MEASIIIDRPTVDEELAHSQQPTTHENHESTNASPVDPEDPQETIETVASEEILTEIAAIEDGQDPKPHNNEGEKVEDPPMERNCNEESKDEIRVDPENPAEESDEDAQWAVDAPTSGSSKKQDRLVDPPGAHASEQPRNNNNHPSNNQDKTTSTSSTTSNPRPWYQDKTFCIVTGVILVVLVVAAVIIAVFALTSSDNDNTTTVDTDSDNAPPTTSPTIGPSSDNNNDDGDYIPVDDNGLDFRLLFGSSPEARFGSAVACTSGEGATSTSWTRCIVGAPQDDGTGLGLYPGYVRVLQYDLDNSNPQWTRLGNDRYGRDVNDRFGWAVDLNENGSIIAVGAPNHDYIVQNATTQQPQQTILNAGMVQVLEWDGSFWNPVGQKLYGSSENDHFGFSLSLAEDGTVLAVGAPNTNQVHVYELTFNVKTNSNQWQILGDFLVGQQSYEGFGTSVALSKYNDEIVVAAGAPSANDSTGAVQLFGWAIMDIDDDPMNNDTLSMNATAGTWIRMGDSLVGETRGNGFGHSVSLSKNGGTIAIGVPSFDSRTVDQQLILQDTGQVRVYEWAEERWIPKGAGISGTVANAYLGYDVELNEDGSMMAAGAWGSSENQDLFESGSVRLWKWNGVFWVQIGPVLLGEDLNDNLGYSVALTSSSINVDDFMIAAGSPLVDSGGLENVGRVRMWQYTTTSSPDSEQNHEDHGPGS